MLQLDRGKRAIKRLSMSHLLLESDMSSQVPAPLAVAPDMSHLNLDESDRVFEALSDSIGEPLLMISDYSVHELPGEEASDAVVDLALTTRIEILEAENQNLKSVLVF